MSTPPVPAYAQRDTGVQVEQLRQSARRWRRMFRTLIVLLLLLTWLAFTENTSYEYRQTLASVSQRDTNLATAVEHYVVRAGKDGASAIADLCAQLIAHPPRDDEISLLPPRPGPGGAQVPLAMRLR